MDDSSLVAAIASGVIFATFYIGSVFYLFSYNKRDNGRTYDESHVYSWTFHVESLRFYGMLAFVVVLGLGALVTEKSGLDTIEDPTETVIFELFGFNHSCNYIDHNPVRMLAAILILPFVQVPLMVYIIFWHARLAKSVKAGQAPNRLLTLSRVLSPYNFIVMSQLHLWFVNNPNDTYGFVAHYIPYLMFQISICFIKLLNLIYLTSKGNLPFGISAGLAWAYIAFFFGITIFYAVVVITTLAGTPVFDAGRSSGEKLFTNILTATWAVLAIFGTLIFSGKERLNGDNITLTIGDNMLQMENSPPKDEEALLEEKERGVVDDDDDKQVQVKSC